MTSLAPPLCAGIQKNAQALQHMLKHPLLYRSSKPKLDTLQKHYVPKERRVNLCLPEHANGPLGLPQVQLSTGHAFPVPHMLPACCYDCVRR